MGKGAAGLASLANALCEETRSKGAEYFDESADNLTGVLVDMAAYFVDSPVQRTLQLR